MGLRRVELTALAVGGEALGREPDGRVVFVAGGAPGDVVDVDLFEEKRRFARGHIVRLLEPSPERVAPPCPHVADGCGGCDWQHVRVDAQRAHRRRLAADALARQAGIVDPEVVDGPVVPIGARTTVRGTADEQGHFAFRKRRSNDPVPIEQCLIVNPLVEEIMTEGRFPAGADVTIRVGARTGERLVIVDSADRSTESDDVTVPDDVVVASEAMLRAGRRFWIHEEAAGRTWRISARSFFQSSPEGAEALVDVVGEQVQQFAPDARVLADLYAGVGLFAGTVGAGRRVIAVERSRSSVADAKVNLADGDVRILELAVGSWRPDPADVVVADPARRGLERAGADAIAATGAPVCVLVTCDVGALGRDARLLGEAGFTHAGSTVVDLFPHTSAAEVISTFVR